MKKILLASATLLTFVGTSFAANATGALPAGSKQGSMEVTADATVTIARLKIVAVQDQALTFGSLTIGNTAGQAVVVPAAGTAVTATTLPVKADGTITSTAGIGLPAGQAAKQAYIKVFGEAAVAYTVTLPSTDVTLTAPATFDNPAGGTIILSNFKLSGTTSRTLTTVTLAAASAPWIIGDVLYADGFGVGCTVGIPAGQVSGDYVGTYKVKVEYQ